MAVAITNKASGSGSTTSSFSITSGRLYLISIYGNVAPPYPAAPTLTGLSQTWDVISHNSWDDQGSGDTRGLSVFRCRASSDQTGTVTFDWGVAMSTVRWSVNEVTGDNTSGTNGSGAIGDTDFSKSEVNQLSGAVTALTLEGAESANYATWSHRANEVTNVEATWTELTDLSVAANHSFEVQYQINDSTATASWSTSSKWAGAAVEIKVAAAGAVPTPGGQMVWGMA